MPIQRSIERFRRNPTSIRNATIAIISVIATVVLIGAVVIRLFDPEEFPSYGESTWFVLQTVTTVGYGDVTPKSWAGRATAAAVMLCAIALITVVTASITSLFVEAAREQQTAEEEADRSETLDRIEASLARLHARLDQLEAAQQAPGSGTTGAD